MNHQIIAQYFQSGKNILKITESKGNSQKNIKLFHNTTLSQSVINTQKIRLLAFFWEHTFDLCQDTHNCTNIKQYVYVNNATSDCKSMGLRRVQSQDRDFFTPVHCDLPEYFLYSSFDYKRTNYYCCLSSCICFLQRFTTSMYLLLESVRSLANRMFSFGCSVRDDQRVVFGGWWFERSAEATTSAPRGGGKYWTWTEAS